jgi:hypothetical protein
MLPVSQHLQGMLQNMQCNSSQIHQLHMHAGLPHQQGLEKLIQGSPWLCKIMCRQVVLMWMPDLWVLWQCQRPPVTSTPLCQKLVLEDR